MTKIRKIFDVLIHDKPYSVYDIEGKEHGGLNGEPKTWWLYYSEALPGDLYPSIDSDYWKPYCKSINRRLWDIKITQRNTSKVKWNEHNFSNRTAVEMWCNGTLVYSFGTTGSDSGLSFAFAKVQYYQTMFSEHVYNFFEPKKNDGRKIFWLGLPAIVKVKSNGWEIGIKPDYEALSKDKWWEEYEKRTTKIGKKKDEFCDMEEEEFKKEKESDYINWGDAFEDKHIDWFRD